MVFYGGTTCNKQELHILHANLHVHTCMGVQSKLKLCISRQVHGIFQFCFFHDVQG